MADNRQDIPEREPIDKRERPDEARPEDQYAIAMEAHRVGVEAVARALEQAV